MPNAIKTRLADLLDHEKFTPREISWLSFNAPVLQEAADESVPIIERVRYLGIFSNNSDEFFRVRVAEVRDHTAPDPQRLRGGPRGHALARRVKGPAKVPEKADSM